MASSPALPSNMSSEASSQSEEDPTTSNHTQSSSSNQEVELSRNETQAVKRGKLVVYLVLAIAAAAMGAVTYVLTYNDEKDDYQKDVSYAQPIFFFSRSAV